MTVRPDKLLKILNEILIWPEFLTIDEDGKITVWDDIPIANLEYGTWEAESSWASMVLNQESRSHEKHNVMIDDRSWKYHFYSVDPTWYPDYT